MDDKLAVIVFGNQNSGKSHTWNSLFHPNQESTVRTGPNLRRLYLNKAQYVEVFLVSGSAEERNLYVGEIINGDPKIVLCSIQYSVDAKDTFNYLYDNGYRLYIQWLNPGYSDQEPYEDELNWVDYFIERGSLVSKKNGEINPRSRVRELRDYIVGWATTRNLVCTDW